uniref:hypothetical protein n=1 Tax=uncultured Clostridium sp. TaxID=59620 RepID=UPI0025ECAEBE
MNKLKKLQEKRAAIITEMEEANESRVFDIFESKELELKELDKEINAEKRMLELKKNKNVNIDNSKDIENEVDEIRNAIENNEELDLRELEVRTMTIGEATDGNICKRFRKRRIQRKEELIYILKEPTNRL